MHDGRAATGLSPGLSTPPVRRRDLHDLFSPVVRLGCPVFVLALGLVSVAGCGTDDQTHQAALRDLQQQKQLSTERIRQIQARDLELQALKRELEEAESRSENVQKALENATRSMEDLARAQAQAEARAAQFRKLVAQFRKMTEAGKLKVEIRNKPDDR